MPTANTAKPITLPINWPEHYSDIDIENIQFIEAERQRRKLSVPAMALGMHCSERTLMYCLNGQYTSPPGKWIQAAVSYLQGDDTSALKAMHAPGGPKPVVATSIHRITKAACKRAHVYRSFSVVSANVGLGKTDALTAYANENKGVAMIDGVPGMSASILLDDLVEATGATVNANKMYSRGTLAERMRAVMRAIKKGAITLIIIDEAEKVAVSTLEYVRRLRDLCNVGVVLSGTLALESQLRGRNGRFGQISSRVTYWADNLTSITREDTQLLLEAYMADDDIELTEDIVSAFWEDCDGNARVLCEGLVLGVRDYLLKDGLPVTPDGIHGIATEILGYK